MGVSWPELNLDLNSGFVPNTISDFLTDLSLIDNNYEKVSKLDDFVHVIKDEMRKIDAFKRELPFCMRLLNDVVDRLNEEKMQYVETEVRPVLDAFSPLKGKSDEDERVKWSNDFTDKKNWMSSPQLRTTENREIKEQNFILNLESQGEKSKIENRGGAFLPFEKESGGSGSCMKGMSESLAVHGMSLTVPAGQTGLPDLDPKGKMGREVARPSSSVVIRTHRKPEEATRKQRRCWSVPLHRNFLNALQQLGGAHVATPKQISEIMKEEGLTNDEIKSHLQKYRLHIRKVPGPPPTSTETCSWLGRDTYKANNVAQSRSPRGPLLLSSSSKGASNTGGNSMEDEDEKSEISHGWKGHMFHHM